MMDRGRIKEFFRLERKKVLIIIGLYVVFVLIPTIPVYIIYLGYINPVMNTVYEGFPTEAPGIPVMMNPGFMNQMVLIITIIYNLIAIGVIYLFSCILMSFAERPKTKKR